MKPAHGMPAVQPAAGGIGPASNQTTARAAGASVQWAATRNVSSSLCEPVQRQSGTPAALWNETRPTHGWAFPSGSPYWTAAAGPTNATSTATAASGTNRLRIRLSPLVEM